MSLKFPISLVGKRGASLDSSYLGGSVTPQSVNVQTYSNFNIGDPDPNRIILIAIGGRYSGSTWSGAAVKVGGIQATLVTRTSFGQFTGVALYKVSIPDGTTADVEITKPGGSTSSINGFNAYRVIANDLALVSSDQDACLFYNYQCGEPYVSTGMSTTVTTVPNSLVFTLGYWRFSEATGWGPLILNGITRDGMQEQSGCSLLAASDLADGSDVTVTAQTTSDTADGKRILSVCLVES